MENPQKESQDAIVESTAVPDDTSADTPRRSVFPHDLQSDHWDADFSNSKEVYEGMALPLWILAGWAIFIIWAVVYLTAGVRSTF